MTRLDLTVWRDRAAQHESRVEPWVAPRQERKRTGATHPVDDFLFDYYPYSIAKLRAWHPGYGVELLGSPTQLHRFLSSGNYRRTDHGATVDASLLPKHLPRLRLVGKLLHNTLEHNEPTGCFGMHEWAMVYGLDATEVRHTKVPLRLAPEQIKATVDAVGLRCTHLDAYRFFTAEATPRNAQMLTRANQPHDERAGCLHANMDLYKYSMWFSPFIGSDLIANAFALAREARDLDMRAAPYDLRSVGYSPIPLETADGRRQYASEQRAIARRAQPIREELLAAIMHLIEVATSEAVLYPDSKSQLDPTPA